MRSSGKSKLKWIAFWGSVASIVSLLAFVVLPRTSGSRSRSHDVQGNGNTVAGGNINVDQAPKYRAATVLTNPTYVFESSDPSDRLPDKPHFIGVAEKGAEITVIEEKDTWGGLESHVLILSGRLSGKKGWVNASGIQLIQLVDGQTGK
jgi:hypothetical protein